MELRCNLSPFSSFSHHSPYMQFVFKRNAHLLYIHFIQLYFPFFPLLFMLFLDLSLKVWLKIKQSKAKQRKQKDISFNNNEIFTIRKKRKKKKILLLC